MPERYVKETWQRRYRPIADWDAMFRAGHWDYLASAAEAPRYAAIAGYLHRHANDVSAKRRGAPVRVLDAGCGQGVLSDHLDPARIALTGFDPSPAAIIRARTRRGVWFEAGVDPIPVEGPFEAIVFNEVLYVLPDPLGTLARYRALLAPGGIAVLSLFQNPNPDANASILSRMLEAELAAGALIASARARVTDLSSGLTWDVTCLTSET